MSRRGFTLIELLTVIVVIAILSSLLLVGGMWVITSSREASTRSTLQKVNRLIKDRQEAYWQFTGDFAHGNYKALRGKFDKEVGAAMTPRELRVKVVRDAVFGRIEAQAGLPTDPNWNERLATQMVQIEMERLFFPQTWDEAEYLRAVFDEPAIASDPNSPTENAEVLHWSLTSRSSVGTLPVDADVITETMVADTDNNGRKEIVDAWGHPIRFYRWPTRLISDNPDIARILIQGMDTAESKDPRNPYNLGNLNEPDYYLPSTYHASIVVSAGPGGEFGLLNPVSKADYGYWGKVGNVQFAYDDLTDK